MNLIMRVKIAKKKFLTGGFAVITALALLSLSPVPAQALPTLGFADVVLDYFDSGAGDRKSVV